MIILRLSDVKGCAKLSLLVGSTAGIHTLVFLVPKGKLSTTATDSHSVTSHVESLIKDKISKDLGWRLLHKRASGYSSGYGVEPSAYPLGCCAHSK